VNNSIIIDKPEQIEAYQILAMRGAMYLETLGLKHSRGSAYAAVKKKFGFKGSKKKVLEQLNKWIDENLLKDRLDKL